MDDTVGSEYEDPTVASTTPRVASGAAASTTRMFMIAIATDAGPRLLAFRIANLLIGRLPDNNISINHGSVSRRHVTLSITNAGMIVEDLGSQNGTTINGTRVAGKQPLKPGDILRVGHVPIFYFGFIRPEKPPGIETIDSAIQINPLVSPM